MLISTIILNGIEHHLVNPIMIVEEDYLAQNGKRMTKMYNSDFRLLGYGTDPECMRESMKEEVNLIINSYLFDKTYIHEKPMLKECILLRDKIIRHVYGSLND